MVLTLQVKEIYDHYKVQSEYEGMKAFIYPFLAYFTI